MYAPLTLPDAAAWMHTSLMLCMIICDYSRPLWMLSVTARPLLVALGSHGCCAARVAAARGRCACLFVHGSVACLGWSCVVSGWLIRPSVRSFVR